MRGAQDLSIPLGGVIDRPAAIKLSVPPLLHLVIRAERLLTHIILVKLQPIHLVLERFVITLEVHLHLRSLGRVCWLLGDRLIKVGLKDFFSCKEQRLDHLLSNEIQAGNTAGKVTIVRSDLRMLLFLRLLGRGLEGQLRHSACRVDFVSVSAKIAHLNRRQATKTDFLLAKG